MSHPERARLAEIVVVRPDGERRRGCGYLVAPGWVLTAEHVIADAVSLAVWFGAPQILDSQRGTAVAPGRVVRAGEADLALLPVDPPLRITSQDNVLLGRLDRSATEPAPIVAAGFPRFKLRPAPHRPGVELREVHYATGSIAAGSNVKTGTLELRVLVEPAEDPEPDRHSPWEGMSGAAVFASGRVVGVVGQHHPRESRQVLTVRPLTELFEPGIRKDLARWQRALPQLGDTVDDLGLATSPSARDLTVQRAQRAAASLTPPVLVAREEDLAELAAFISGEERWRWVQGAAFAGKTALLAWFALHPPLDVNVAACFLRRTTGDADARYALDVLNRQLAVHAERSYQPALHLSQQRDDFLDLVTEAALASKQRGHRLLILVDGLDEDQTGEPGLAVASWLPDARTVSSNAWLLVASRAEVEVGLPPAHPLTRRVQPLSASEAATEIERMAESELEQARKAGDLVTRVLGLLAAAYEGLATADLTELLRRHWQAPVLEVEVVDALKDRLARTVLRNPDPDGLNEHVLVFAHDMLLDRARTVYGADLPYLRDEVLQWCHAWALRADTDPDQVPRYVARHYAGRLADADTWTDLWNDLLQPSWAQLRDRAPAHYLPYRGDLERLLRTARRFNREAVAAGRPAPALAAAVAATITMASVESQFQATTAKLGAVWVETGLWSSPRALQYLASIKERDERAMAVGIVAPVLDPKTIPEVFDLYRGLEGRSDEERGFAAFGVARLLVAAGRGPDACRFAETEAAANRDCEACNAAAGALHGLPPSEAGRLLVLIRTWSAQLSGLELWRFARRLTSCMSRQEAHQVLGKVEPGLDPGEYLLALLQVPSDDLQNLAAALQLAAPWLEEQQLAMRGRALLDAAAASEAEWLDEGIVLVHLASVAPRQLRARILRRSTKLDDGDRMLVLAGLLVVDDGRFTADLLRDLSPSTLPLERFVSGDDQRTFLSDLTRSGHGQLAVEYLRHLTEPPGFSDLEAVAEYLEPQLLRDLLELTQRLEPDEQGWGRAAILPSLARAGPQTAPIRVAGGSWVDAERLAAIGMGWLTPGNQVALPRDAALCLAAVLVATQEGHVPLGPGLQVLASLPPRLVIPVLSEAVASLPIDESALDDLIGLYQYRYGEFVPVQRTRLVHATLRAAAAQLGMEPALDILRSDILKPAPDPWLRAQVIAACGDQLIDTGFKRSALLAQVHGSENKMIARAALAHRAAKPNDEVQRIATRVGPIGFLLGHAHELDVLEALAAPLRPVLLSQLLDDGFLDGSHRPTPSEAPWARVLTELVPSLDRRQLQIVDAAIAATRRRISDVGTGRRSELEAAIAIRWVRLGDFDAFRSTLDRISLDDYLARALVGTVLHLPTEHLTAWYALTERLAPRFNARDRALLWAVARSRRLDRDHAWEILDEWLSSAGAQQHPKFDQSWQVLVDLAGYAPAITIVGGSKAAAQLRDLLISGQLLDAPQGT